MNYIQAGRVIKLLRKKMRITQAQLAGTRMTVETISRIENGKMPIGKANLDWIISRLGHGAKRFFPHPMTEGAFKAYELRGQFKAAAARSDKQVMEKLIGEMEALPDFKEDLHRQRLLKCKADLLKLAPSPDYVEIKALLLEAIKISIADFKPKLINTYLLTGDDQDIIGTLATVFYEEGKHDEALEMLEKLDANISRNMYDAYETARSQSFVSCLLSMYLGQQGRYEEALAACNKGIEAGEANGAYGMLPELNFNKAYIMYHMNDHDEVPDLLYKAYYCALAHGNHHIASQIKENANKIFGKRIYIKG